MWGLVVLRLNRRRFLGLNRLGRLRLRWEWRLTVLATCWQLAVRLLLSWLHGTLRLVLARLLLLLQCVGWLAVLLRLGVGHRRAVVGAASIICRRRLRAVQLSLQAVLSRRRRLRVGRVGGLDVGGQAVAGQLLGALRLVDVSNQAELLLGRGIRRAACIRLGRRGPGSVRRLAVRGAGRGLLPCRWGLLTRLHGTLGLAVRLLTRLRLLHSVWLLLLTGLVLLHAVLHLLRSARWLAVELRLTSLRRTRLLSQLTCTLGLTVLPARRLHSRRLAAERVAVLLSRLLLALPVGRATLWLAVLRRGELLVLTDHRCRSRRGLRP